MVDPIDRLTEQPSPKKGFVITEAIGLAVFSSIFAAAQILEPGDHKAVVVFGFAATLCGIFAFVWLFHIQASRSGPIGAWAIGLAAAMLAVGVAMASSGLTVSYYDSSTRSTSGSASPSTTPSPTPGGTPPTSPPPTPPPTHTDDPPARPPSNRVSPPPSTTDAPVDPPTTTPHKKTTLHEEIQTQVSGGHGADLDNDGALDLYRTSEKSPADQIQSYLDGHRPIVLLTADHENNCGDENVTGNGNLRLSDLKNGDRICLRTVSAWILVTIKQLPESPGRPLVVLSKVVS